MLQICDEQGHINCLSDFSRQTTIAYIGNNFALDEGVGMCGKGGQSVPAGVGRPTLLIDRLTVGGTAA